MNENKPTLAYEEYFAHRKLWDRRFLWCLLLMLMPGALWLLSPVIDWLTGPLGKSGLGDLVFLMSLFPSAVGLAFMLLCERKTHAIDSSIEDPAKLVAFKERYTEDSYIREGHPWFPFWRIIGWGCAALLAIVALSICFWTLSKAALFYAGWPLSLKVFFALIIITIAGGVLSETVESMLFEDVKMANGQGVVSRLSTGTILTSSLLCIPFGVWMFSDGVYFGATLIFTLCPCFLLYPLIRKLFFGGTDSVAGVITTVVVEEVMKAGINSAINKMNDKNEHRR